MVREKAAGAIKKSQKLEKKVEIPFTGAPRERVRADALGCFQSASERSCRAGRKSLLQGLDRISPFGPRQSAPFSRDRLPGGLGA